MKYFAKVGAWKCQLDRTCLSCIAEGTVSNPSPVKPEATCEISAEKLDGFQSHQSEPFTVSLNVPLVSACGRERGGLRLCELRLCELFGRSQIALSQP